MANPNMGKKKYLTAERLREIVDYDPVAGTFRWKIHGHGRKISGVTGDKVGYNGYRCFTFEKVTYLVHRLAWLYVHGNNCRGKIMFKDGDKTNCRIENLDEMRSIYGWEKTRPERRNISQKLKRQKYPHIYKEYEIKRKFGITFAEYTAMAVAQNNCCAICEKSETATFRGKVRALAVDHNHETGENRGLLCQACNILIGYAGENEDTLIAAIKYLQKHNGTRKTFVPKLVKTSTNS